MSAPTANFTVSTTALIVPAVFLSFAICCVGLRVYVRTGLLRSFLVEDWLCILTLIFFSAHAGLLFGIEASLATPKPSLEVYEKIINIVISDVVIYLCASIALKLSLAFFFLRFVVERWQRVLIYVFLAIFIANSVSSIFLVLFWCSDPTKYAMKTIMGQCTGTNPALNAANILQGTQMIKREKAIVAGIFALAVAGSVAAILRAVYWPALVKGTLSGFRKGMMWSTIEIGAGIIASSAATLRPLLKKVNLGKNWSRKSRSGVVSNEASLPDSEKGFEKEVVKVKSAGSGSQSGSDSKEWWDAEVVSPEAEILTEAEALRLQA
ncbi:hypothetical protein M438DRAFT_372902 [Aureobasidium pullulans EXF-150]|uniref:Rhodopsin domain-containing protein n=1 Tax=Aureobasidium pullulans EXF-150 TaxID=1043002 RepID=A0A074XL78_AURPU|nr:uncharacterized protein M438DRAFT_372902 [Aureobasidium pullulans EXF-150]KEQ86270.1 hypothetical protein M438DRAFT_372902 [Aureobasidium pullulans EXF-150]